MKEEVLYHVIEAIKLHESDEEELRNCLYDLSPLVILC